MAKMIRLSEDLIEDAAIYGKAEHRSPPKQIEHWAKLGKIAEENPDLTLDFIKGILTGMEEANAGLLTEYKFG